MHITITFVSHTYLFLQIVAALYGAAVCAFFVGQGMVHYPKFKPWQRRRQLARRP